MVFPISAYVDPCYVSPPAKNFGYAFCPDLTLNDPEYEFVKVGEPVCGDYEFWLSGEGPWTRVDEHDEAQAAIGRPIDVSVYPIRRKVNRKPARWSCGHGRDDNASCCPVCAVVYFRRVED